MGWDKYLKMCDSQFVRLIICPNCTSELVFILLILSIYESNFFSFLELSQLMSGIYKSNFFFFFRAGPADEWEYGQEGGILDLLGIKEVDLNTDIAILVLMSSLVINSYYNIVQFR